MELEVAVLKVEIRALEQFDLRCKVESGAETHTSSSTVSLAAARSCGSWPTFRFPFTSPSPTATLQFTAFDSAGSPELGSCIWPLTLQGSNVFSKQAISNETQVALLSLKIEGIEVPKFVGKVWFRVTPNFQPSQNQSTLLLDLISREAADKCSGHLPSATPTVSVVFHCIDSTTLAKSPKQLTPVACIGSMSGISNGAIFHEEDERNPTLIPILKPITLRCSQHHTLELHMGDRTSGKVLFSSSHHISSLTPFKHSTSRYNWNWMSGNKSLIPSRIPASQEPSIIISLVYKPASSEFDNYEGLEFYVHSMNITSTMLHRDVVLCAQLVSYDSKSRVQGAGGHDPPFERRANKKGIQSEQTDSFYNYNVAVVRFNAGKERQSTDPAYFFFPADPYFITNKSGVALTIHIYAADALESQPWWQTSLIASARLEITDAHLKKLLEQRKIGNGVHWELSDSDIMQSSDSPVTTKICGVIRWKSKEAKFLSHPLQLDNLPKYRDLLLVEPECEASDPSLSPVLHIPPAGILTSLLSEHVTAHTAPSEEECTAYRNALAKMGQDILKLRQGNAMLQEENRELLAHVNQMRTVMGITSADQTELKALSREEMVQRILKLQENLSAESQSRRTYQDKVSVLQNTVIRKNDFEVQYFELQDAHTAQQELIRQLRAKIEKYRKCSETCRQQEKVITQLELLLAQQTRGQGDSDTLSHLSKENAHLRAVLKDYQEEREDHSIQLIQTQLSKLTSKCQDLELQVYGAQGACSGTHDLQSSKVSQLELKLVMSEARASTLMAQLQENARRWALERAAYELQLAEYRSKIGAAQTIINPPVVKQTF